jgi:DNA polymerase
MDAQQIEQALLSALAWWDEAGVEVAQPMKAKRKTPPKARQTPHAQRAAQTNTPAARPAPVAPSDDSYVKAAETMVTKCKTLAELKAAIEGFDAGALSDGTRGAVVSRGNPEADIMVIGEAPGPQEDAAGQPFIGPSGQLLDKIFASIGLDEHALYLTNVVNWKLPNNRKPTEAELAICKPIITAHIALKKPKLIVLVGGVSMNALTGLKGITKTRGAWETITTETKDGETPIPALITYHPAYLLRQPHLKREVWRDMLSLKAKIEAL